jgi:hypothetical protein
MAAGQLKWALEDRGNNPTSFYEDAERERQHHGHR